MLASVWSDWASVTMAAVAVVVSVAAWRAAVRSALAAERSAKAAEEQADADRETAHLARTPRLELTLGLDHGDGTVEVELVNRGPVALDRIDFEVAVHWSTGLSVRGMVLRHDQPGSGASNAGELGPLKVAESRELQVSHTDFWLRLTCVAPDGEEWVRALEVPAMSGPIGQTTSTTDPDPR